MVQCTKFASCRALDERTYECRVCKVIVVERDRENLRARMQVQAAEKRLNSAVNAHATLTAVPRADNETELQIHTESSILGKLGEFGQAVMRRKADQIVEEFARNMAKAINATA